MTAGKWLAGVGALLILPLGISASFHRPAPHWFEFPPLTRTLAVPDFYLPIFLLFTLLLGAALLVLVRPMWFGFRIAPIENKSTGGAHSFPLRGYAGIGLLALFWILAWTRFSFVPSLIQQHTFFPLWFGYILILDAWTFRRAGVSWISRSPRSFAALFPASAIAWWYFEWVNRSVQNWWYLGVEAYTATHYVLMATLAFSTVFPAIFLTREWLMTFPWFQSAYRHGPRWPTPVKSLPYAFGLLGVGWMVLTGQFPARLFFLTWLAPLAILGATLALARVPNPFSTLGGGDYTQLVSLAVAALICGFFWELWNYGSWPKWEYTVPYVQALHLFEMPLPGYGGYMPFGPICWCMWLAIQKGARGKHT
jgi:hypothetical protein